MDLENEAVIRRAAQWAKADEKSRHRALREFLSSAHGRSYIYDILQECGVYRSAFSSDPLRMAYFTGQQAVGLWIMADIQAVDPSAYHRMIAERNQRNADRTELLDAAATEPVAGDTGWSGEPNLANPVLYPPVNYDVPDGS